MVHLEVAIRNYQGAWQKRRNAAILVFAEVQHNLYGENKGKEINVVMLSQNRI